MQHEGFTNSLAGIAGPSSAEFEGVPGISDHIGAELCCGRSQGEDKVSSCTFHQRITS